MVIIPHVASLMRATATIARPWCRSRARDQHSLNLPPPLTYSIFGAASAAPPPAFSGGASPFPLEPFHAPPVPRHRRHRPLRACRQRARQGRSISPDPLVGHRLLPGLG